MTVMITGAAGRLVGRSRWSAPRAGDLLLTNPERRGLGRLSQGIRRLYGVPRIPEEARHHRRTCRRRADRVCERRGAPLDILLNVAGLVREAFLERGFGDISAMLRVNVENDAARHRALSWLRRADGQFHIVFVSSLASMCRCALKATYAASKRFLLDFSIALGRELERENVSVLALCPGGMPTRDDCIRAIEAQGFWGRATTTALETVTRRTIAKALRGKKVYVPGAVNLLFSILGKVVPPLAVAKLVYRRWSSVQKKLA